MTSWPQIRVKSKDIGGPITPSQHPLRTHPFKGSDGIKG
jgi:hypothetical protein